MRLLGGGSLGVLVAVATLIACSPSTAIQEESTPERGEATAGRAVVVIEGGGGPHPFTTPWRACDGGRADYVQAMLDVGLAVFTAPGYSNVATSVDGESGCPPQPPTEVQWNTSGYPTQAGTSVLGFLGFLNQTYGYTTFDLVGYSYGGLVARATVGALRSPPTPDSMAPAFSFSQFAVAAGVDIMSIATLNSPHLGAPAYDVANDPAVFFEPVATAWGQQYADAGKLLVPSQRELGAGAIQILETRAHATPDPDSWDAQQVGMLDGVSLTLIAGDYCGTTCGDDRAPLDGDASPGSESLRTDGTVPVYSQLMLPCPSVCPSPPGSVYLPEGLVPQTGVVRRVFPTAHSTFITKPLGLPEDVAVSHNVEAMDYLVSVVQAQWSEAGAPLLPSATSG